MENTNVHTQNNGMTLFNSIAKFCKQLFAMHPHDDLAAYTLPERQSKARR